MARCPSGPRSPVSSGRRESWSISAFRPARELEPRPARQWLSKQNLPSGIILAPPVVGHPRRRGAKDDRDEDAVAGAPARLVLHRLFLRGRVRAASISVSHWCVRGLRCEMLPSPLHESHGGDFRLRVLWRQTIRHRGKGGWGHTCSALVSSDIFVQEARALGQIRARERVCRLQRFGWMGARRSRRREQVVPVFLNREKDGRGTPRGRRR